ncbi:MAG: hypothetical protein KRP56_07005 [Candidatus Methanogranum gryphiswaldense]|nr:MAG: hypothetical protein KRP56_07005 [Candidatus Methanogranum sp. U3.2.1]
MMTMAAADNPEKKLAAGMKAMDEGDFKKAYTAFKKLVEEYPNNAECWYYKAECGNYASGMFGAKVSPEEIMEAYKKAIELDGDRVDYYQSYGLFCISINKYDEAEKAYKEAAQIDESMESSLYSEFAIEYFNNVMATYGEIMEDPKARAPYAKKALEYMLKALEISPEEAKTLL